MDETNLDFPIGTSIIDLVISHRVLTTKKIRQIGLYPGQDLLLIELLRQDHRSQNELVRALNVDHSTIAKSANRLFKTGVIDSQKSAKDKRVTIISLTTKGRALAEQAAEIWRDVEQAVREELSPEDVALFITYAKKITATFNQRSNEAEQPNQSC
ncbi:winged helix-turn-helix transcriptional regulator [Levilactobacillus brevis]|uniref:MarR family winged helix-turn-helix transcriptional regulator n=1 Tax=Levilactobacillus brevis TaxID=1580 RepID=UPI001BAD986F|nr:MarR family winged helix-turn-helix transcriptional regulator [Levilactobacillus brevis]MBS1006710.1 winged helix-turn-helix transcriptional regulator [Levilactobacillus brevis]MBS1013814.1 winged helix-turn-helix transcriptional regulator [Levilactobacillus brevis]